MGNRQRLPPDRAGRRGLAKVLLVPATRNRQCGGMIRIGDGSVAMRWFAPVLIACALFARIVVPQGWMPSQGAEGWRITLCAGTGPMTMAMPEAIATALDKNGHPASDGHQPGDHPCSFAAVAAALDGPPAVAVALPMLAAAVWRPASIFAVSVGQGLVAPPPPSTGPPSTL